MKKKFILTFTFIFSILLWACSDPELEKIYPSSITIPDAGTLKYTKTYWDAPHNKYNKRSGGTSIYDAKLVDNEIWIFASWGNYGQTLFKGINKSASITIQYPKKGDSFRYSVESSLMSKGKYIVFCVRNDTTYYDDGSKNIYYIARLDRKTLKREYIRMSDKFDGKDWPNSYNDNENVFISFKNYYTGSDWVYNYYKINDDCDDFIEITEKEFNDLYAPNPDYIVDSIGRYYRINKGKLGVSLDNGNTWYENDMGTNIPVSIIVQNDSVYVFCSTYSEQNYNLFLGPEIVGGGIHEFKWQK